VRAPAYRNLHARSTFLGLAFPAEWMVVLATGWLGTTFGAPNIGAAAVPRFPHGEYGWRDPPPRGVRS
jgi:hypothetical protein